jgi:hypothetical protein
MDDGQSDIAHNAVEGSVGQNDGHLLPGMEVGIRFKNLGALEYVRKQIQALCSGCHEVKVE